MLPRQSLALFCVWIWVGVSGCAQPRPQVGRPSGVVSVAMEGYCPKTIVLQDPVVRVGRADSTDVPALHVNVKHLQMGQDLPGVSVWLGPDTSKAKAIVSALTNFQGSASLTGVGAGEYWLGADYIGFTPVRARVHLLAARRDTVVLQLQSNTVGCETRRR